jgi:hypothetical protein
MSRTNRTPTFGARNNRARAGAFRRHRPDAAFQDAFRKLVVLIGGAAFGAGCYSFSGSNLPSYIKTVVVPTIENETLEPGIEQEITIGLTEEFVEDGRLKLGTTSTADARLDARLTQYDNKVNNYSASQQPLDYILVVSLDVQLRDMVKNRELWSDDRLTATAVYVPGGTSGLTTEREARQQVIQEIARDVVTRTLEQW